MDMAARRQYFEILKARYHCSKKREEKTTILNEYCENTQQNRKYAIQKFNCFLCEPSQKHKRAEVYGSKIIAALIKAWEIFDYPCGQRLKSQLEKEIDRLRKFKEIRISDKTVDKLKRISSATIDRKLKRQKGIMSIRMKHNKKQNPLLYQTIPIKTSHDQNRSDTGLHQMDFVEHCGDSAAGTYLFSMSFVNVTVGWWEGEAIMGAGQIRTVEGFREIEKRAPLKITEIHVDNDKSFLNRHLKGHCNLKIIDMSRSRPYKKNDNCFVEQKNLTHVRNMFGHMRCDTEQEQAVINDIYHNELRLYKNFFQPIMSLKEKRRVKSKILRKYCKPTTPFHKIMASKAVPKSTKQELQKIYDSLNPAALKRQIDKKTRKLFALYEKKMGKSKANPRKKQVINVKTLGKVFRDSMTQAWVR